MKKLVLSLAIISALGLSGCGSETIEDVKNDAANNITPIVASARIVFDPASGIAGMSVPNDLIFSGSLDGTLEIPDLDDPTDGSDPFVAASALDGWSTVQPFVIDIAFPAGRTLDGISVSDTSSVRVFEVLKDGDSSDADCASKDPTKGLICKVVGELVFGQDYITKAAGNSVAFVPLKPLKGKTSYIIALTDSLLDNLGNSIAGSTTYESVRQDINTNPLATPTQLGLQGVINSYEAAAVSAGVDSDKIIYTMAMTTQSTTDVSFTVKSLLAAPLAQGGLPPKITINDSSETVSDFLYEGTPPSEELDELNSTANYHTGSITLPYYSGVPMVANFEAPVNDWWKGLCDSGAMLARFAAAGGTIPEGPLSASDGACMAVSAAAGLPAPGLRDLSSVMTLDTERNLTKYSPVPAQRAPSDIPWITKYPGEIDIQMTTPVISANTDEIRAEYDLPPLTVMPDAGWPVVILQHGLAEKKEEMLKITGMLSVFGFATIAIDHPLHGSRGFDLVDGSGNPGPDGIDDINATTVSAVHYMNIGSLLTSRDNVRQSLADMLGLRLGLNYTVIGDGSGARVDTNNVHFLGQSIGAITGVSFMALTNTSIGNEIVDAMFNVKTNSFSSLGTMSANLLMESPAFGDLIKANLTYASSSDFKAFVDSFYAGNHTDEQLVTVYQGFYANLAATDPETLATLEAGFAQFTLIAQTATDSSDPVNYTALLAASQTPTHAMLVVGTGVDCVDIVAPNNCSDQTIPNRISTSPLGGGEGAITLLGLPSVSSTVEGSGAVRFIYGHHSSVIDSVARPTMAPDPVTTAAVTKEMQLQVAKFFADMGQNITVTNEDVVLQ
jgi:Pla-1/cef family extracellular lipase